MLRFWHRAASGTAPVDSFHFIAELSQEAHVKVLALQGTRISFAPEIR
jgi:hypothetical protein